ncbi:hypothetical protein A3C89_02240 [Candidatus Kaiserbacteria bacterium RIFCSPHIGHO2_02_FULL_50_50]|uniref:Uncharacterized protein n=1 Tax=Candidatus Kaiserbacteria bacterium RIFCSPHIGHO2_02_FULL_50_50 TaxID=1798492 RepID=A0A1F6DFP1_9BACT|nr:MAG: hypothetical protein A3C89_02240 [Candidatus Kaiserbacteria bacterium RIFCSPHIGHO2_02_FULL_50_50]OGG88618.1 MAG: hypothetical protein A3G62_00785 [Candidatus Kaiserbacteria bacterium RIFCSPLOWO2_12_FULL_50_10]
MLFMKLLHNKIALALLGVAFLIFISIAVYRPSETARIDGTKTPLYAGVVQDAIDQYEMAYKNGDFVRACVQAKIVTQLLLQAKDETAYNAWRAKEEKTCEEYAKSIRGE